MASFISKPVSRSVDRITHIPLKTGDVPVATGQHLARCCHARLLSNRVRFTAQLIEAMTRHHLWADRYDRELADVFALQDEIARSIAGAIEPGIKSQFEFVRSCKKMPTANGPVR
jgi:hypothetical protein